MNMLHNSTTQAGALKAPPTPQRKSEDRLGAAYKLIGAEVTRYLSHNRRNPASAFEEFRQAVVFINTPTLDSYLEDVLNPRVSAEKLHLECSQRKIGSLLWMLTFCCAGVLCLNWMFFLLPLTSLFLFSALLVASLGLLWRCLPQVLLAQRMKAARVVSKEISRRRGHNDSAGISTRVFKDLFPSPTAYLQGAA